MEIRFYLKVLAIEYPKKDKRDSEYRLSSRKTDHFVTKFGNKADNEKRMPFAVSSNCCCVERVQYHTSLCNETFVLW